MKQQADKVNVMIDLETLGTTPGSVILSLGATTFGTGSHCSTFYRQINKDAYPMDRFHTDKDTVLWWKSQGETARSVAFSGTKHPEEVLIAFSFWLNTLGKTPLIWGNGSDFDNVLLSETYRLLGLATPWKFYNNRCYRTLKNLYPEVKLKREGTHHNALDDAITQAKHAEEIFGLIL